jgi:hypothetical protein
MASEKGWLGRAANAVLAEYIDVRIEAAEPPVAFASNRSR